MSSELRVTPLRATLFCLLLAGVLASDVRAQSPAVAGDDAVQARADAADQDEAAAAQEAAAPFRFGAYVETYYQWNFNRPDNDITNYRGFDNRHNTFTLSNIALDTQWDVHDVIGKLTVQVGSTPSTYYLSEPQRAGSSGASGTGSEYWKYLQQAYVGYRAVHRAEHTLIASAGLFLSPIGPESMAVKDNWNWSRSNLFFGCPFYHTGARATYTLRDTWGFTLAAYNGWNSVVDNNHRKSISAQVTYGARDLTASVLYFGGVERPSGASEGQNWRHLFDAHATFHASRWLSLIAHANSGFEHTRFGAERWLAGALYARAQLLSPLWLALRGDVFREHVPHDESGRASPIFWPVAWVSSATATLDYRPHPHISLRAEYRHDHAQGAMFFGGHVQEDAMRAFIPNRRAQNTLTLGATAWY